MAERPDYYKVLGVERSANADQIKTAYRRLARKYHPDVSKEANAEARFKEMQEAYEVLRDPEIHVAAELVGRFERNRAAMAAIALTTDASVVTSIAAHVPIRMDGRSLACPRMLSRTASVPASRVADEDGISAVQ